MVFSSVPIPELGDTLFQLPSPSSSPFPFPLSSQLLPTGLPSPPSSQHVKHVGNEAREPSRAWKRGRDPPAGSRERSSTKDPTTCYHQVSLGSAQLSACYPVRLSILSSCCVCDYNFTGPLRAPCGVTQWVQRNERTGAPLVVSPAGDQGRGLEESQGPGGAGSGLHGS